MRVITDRDGKLQYLADESNAYYAAPEDVEAVYCPGTEEELADILRRANAAGRPVSVSGAGTGITGARVPVHGGIVISTERMLAPRPRENWEEVRSRSAASGAVIYLDRENLRARVPVGITLAELSAMLPHGIIYPPDPTETGASIGGTIATNASGARGFHYGATRNWIERLRIVLADGDILDIGRGECLAGADGMLRFGTASGRKYEVPVPGYVMPRVKNAAGLYSAPGMDLVDMFVGCEGILGVVTEAEIRLAEMAAEPVSDMAFFRSENDALAYVDDLRDMRDRILAVEFFDARSLEFVGREWQGISGGAGAGVYVETAGGMDMLERLSGLLERHGASEDWCAHTVSTRRDLKEMRHALPDGINSYLKRHGSYKLGTDLAVPRAAFGDMMGRYREAGQRFGEAHPRDGQHHVLFGHIGDCHLHFNFITASQEERDTARKLYVELARHAVALNGTISAEHGIGKKTVPVGDREMPYLELMYGRAGLGEIARVKRALDPGNSLNVGNMFPSGYC